MMQGVSRSYRRARRANQVATEDGRSEALHETRKRTKDLRYQLELVRDAWTPVLSGDAKGADELADILGQVQDLEVVRATLHSGRGVDWNTDGVDLLLEQIDRRAAALRSSAEIAGALVFAEKPRAFEKRLNAYVPRTASEAGSSAAA
jgi:CHAD domain-containing protein